jgi:hypothetical protein
MMVVVVTVAPSQQPNSQPQMNIEDIYLSSNDSPGLNTQMVSSPSNPTQQQFNNNQQPRPTYFAPQQQQNQPIIIWSGILEGMKK